MWQAKVALSLLVDMTAISLVTEKQPTDKEGVVQEKSRRIVLDRKCILGTILGFLLVGMLAAAIYVSAVITTNHGKGDMEKNNQQGLAYVSAERVQEFVSSNTRSHVVQFRVPDQGIVIMDFERRLKILTFSHIKHVCFVAEIIDMATEPLSHTDVETNFTMAVKRTPVADVYVADVTYDVKRLPEVAQQICKVAFHAKLTTITEPVRTDRRKKRQCGQSCIMVCDPRTHRCRRQCVRNPCPRRCTRERPCSV